MNSHLTTDNNVSKNVNNASREFRNVMLEEGVITKEQFDEMSNYAIAIVRKSSWGAFWDKLWGEGETKPLFVVVKVLGVEANE